VEKPFLKDKDLRSAFFYLEELHCSGSTTQQVVKLMFIGTYFVLQGGGEVVGAGRSNFSDSTFLF